MTTNNKYAYWKTGSLFPEEDLDESQNIFTGDLDDFDDDFDDEPNDDLYSRELLKKALEEGKRKLGKKETLPLMEVLCTLAMVDEKFEQALFQAHGKQAAQMIETLVLERLRMLGYTPHSELEKQFWIDSVQRILFQSVIDYHSLKLPIRVDWSTSMATSYLGEFLDGDDSLVYDPDNQIQLEKVKKRITKSAIKSRMNRSLKFFKQIIVFEDYLLEILEQWGPHNLYAKTIYQEQIAGYGLLDTFGSLFEQAASEIFALASPKRRAFAAKAAAELFHKLHPTVDEIMSRYMDILDEMMLMDDDIDDDLDDIDDDLDDEKDSYDDSEEEKYFRSRRP